MIVSIVIYYMYFLMSYLAFFLKDSKWMIYAYPICGLSPPFSTISRRFLIRARFGDDILDFSGLLIALATLYALCWIMLVMVSVLVSMSSSYCSVSNRFLSLRWSSIFFDSIWYILFVASWSSTFSFPHQRPVLCCS